jgi:hypothetical protein
VDLAGPALARRIVEAGLVGESIADRELEPADRTARRPRG